MRFELLVLQPPGFHLQLLAGKVREREREIMIMTMIMTGIRRLINLRVLQRRGRLTLLNKFNFFPSNV
jgi:hypothetical protein